MNVGNSTDGPNTCPTGNTKFILNLKNASDWGKVTYRQISEHGGAGLLVQYYKGSLFHCLQSVYKGTLISEFPYVEIQWKRK